LNFEINLNTCNGMSKNDHKIVGQRTNKNLAGKESFKGPRRNRVSSGRALLPDTDGRRVNARRYKDILFGIFAEQGGIEQCSITKQQLVRRYAATSVLAEQLESDLANGMRISVSEHAQLSSTLTRLATRIGLDRCAAPERVIDAPTLNEIAENIQSARADVADGEVLEVQAEPAAAEPYTPKPLWMRG
jgi:hypothetical protein